MKNNDVKLALSYSAHLFPVRSQNECFLTYHENLSFAPSLLSTQQGQWRQEEANSSEVLALIFMCQSIELQGHLSSLWVSGLWPAWPSHCRQWSCSCQPSLQESLPLISQHEIMKQHDFPLPADVLSSRETVVIELILGIRIAGWWPLKF